LANGDHAFKTIACDDETAHMLGEVARKTAQYLYDLEHLRQNRIVGIEADIGDVS